MIKNNHLFNDDKIKFEINDTYNTIDKACKARLNLFNLPSILNYNKILYLDTDIVVKNNINKVIDVCKKDILYVLEEGNLRSPNDYYGQSLFGNELKKYSHTTTAFTSGILLFNNCEKIKSLFNKINEDIIKRPREFECFDQPYIVYNAFKYNLYDNKILKALAVNNDNNIRSDKVIHHFPGCPGIYEHKIVKMTNFLNTLNKYTFKNGMKIYDVKFPPKKNISFSLIGICVSYNYFDSFQFMLPVNHLHFEKMYIITQQNDIRTIELCKKFNNVTVLFFDLIKHDKPFDKYNALNYAQKIAYTEHPESWYLIIDSDIILPNNFIDILNKENLNSDCIYGAIRNNCLKTSELLDKTAIVNNIENINFICNNIVHWTLTNPSVLDNNTPPSILGCFQLYKKKVFCRTNINNAGYGDYYFGHDNFELFCNLGNILYFHLGEAGVNWNGKIVSFINDNNIALNDIYYICHKRFNNIYYNEKHQIVKYGSSENIDHDVWTCSDQMRYDIYDFFKDKSYLKIAEIGAHKGYSTKILANIFSTVYAIDNSVEWTDFNKKYNKDVTNIEYVNLDIYKDSWHVLPDDIEVSFIDAMHTYKGCKSDIINSIKRFKKLQYIILDDYGVWNGVKKIVDELIINNVLIFEKFIGITNVPGPNGIVKNVKEGIICRVNKSNNTKMKVTNNTKIKAINRNILKMRFT
jgi:hypothetical protein